MRSDDSKLFRPINYVGLQERFIAICASAAREDSKRTGGDVTR